MQRVAGAEAEAATATAASDEQSQATERIAMLCGKRTIRHFKRM